MTPRRTYRGAVRVGLIAALVLMATAVLAAHGWAAQPQPWQLGMQPPATPVKDQIHELHNELLIIITLITVFVLGLLLYVIVKYDARRHPVPTRTSHNAVIEILWTVVPVLILVIIAIPSFRLMYYMDRVPDAAMTIKATGNQWYWSYEYPDQKIRFDSNIVADKDLKPGQPRLLEVDNPLVVPVNTNVRVQIAGVPDGVIHSWYMPSFGVQEYAMPGRLNESWFRVEHEGTYYGECNQICGINHSKMPIEVKALAKADYDKWLAEAKKKFAMSSPDDGAPANPAKSSRLAAAAQPDGTEPARSAAAPAGNR